MPEGTQTGTLTGLQVGHVYYVVPDANDPDKLSLAATPGAALAGQVVTLGGDPNVEVQFAAAFLNRIKAQDLTIMTRQLATMVNSGMTILRALYVLEAQTENKKLAEALISVRKDVEAGLPLSDALERHPKVHTFLVEGSDDDEVQVQDDQSSDPPRELPA